MKRPTGLNEEKSSKRLVAQCVLTETGTKSMRQPHHWRVMSCSQLTRRKLY